MCHAGSVSEDSSNRFDQVAERYDAANADAEGERGSIYRFDPSTIVHRTPAHPVRDGVEVIRRLLSIARSLETVFRASPQTARPVPSDEVIRGADVDLKDITGVFGD